jgi:hypothetical protein
MASKPPTTAVCFKGIREDSKCTDLSEKLNGNMSTCLRYLRAFLIKCPTFS